MKFNQLRNKQIAKKMSYAGMLATRDSMQS